MNRDAIAEALDSSRVQLLLALEPLPDEALKAPGAAGSWSIADILAHIVAWESELVTALMRIDQGRRPARLLDLDVDAYNAGVVAANKDRDLDRLFDDLQRVRLQLEEWLEEFSEQQLTRAGYYDWASGKPLWHFIDESSFGHELKHLPDIRAFVEGWQAAQNPGAGGQEK
ncbi:MAG: ClbS/DfsB family four-helix bundle protein [Candidatus Promineifilaceae bacterium]|nr:ClbS/DfsB family four-helix bundle protein [Candidatus Promineifilaceae bacterium]